ncbi:MAG: cellulose synthase catalytic subunit [Vicinamibacterales bacterium]
MFPSELPPTDRSTRTTTDRPSRRFMEESDRTRRLLARFFAVVTVASGAYYLVWALGAVNPAYPLMAGLFLAAEVCCLGLFVLASIGVWDLRFKPEIGLPADRPYSVDVLVPVLGEPIAVVRHTLEAIKAVRWHGQKTVYVLDDGVSDQVQALTGQLGFEYLSRGRAGVPQEDAKAGNLNFGLARSTGELVLVMDADQAPTANILEAMTGYMRFPKVAFVQSKQTFCVSEDDPFFSNDRVFYEALQLGLDAGDSVISCGSGVLYRRAALEPLGGFQTWNLVEDLSTSYELHSHGWKSFYYPMPLSIGLAPQDIWGVYQQRGQWSFDTMRMFFWDNPIFKRGLGSFARLTYLIIALSYLCAGFVFPFFFVVPIWSYLTGGNVLYRPEIEFAIVRGVYFVCMAVAMQLLFRGRQPGKQFQMLTGLFPVYALGTIRGLLFPRGRKPQYRANNQDRARTRRPRVVAILPQLTLLVANAVLPFYAATAGVVPGRLIAANIAISALAIWSLLPVVLATFHGPAAEPELRSAVHGTL